MIDVLQHIIMVTYHGATLKYLFDYTKYMTISKAIPEKRTKYFVHCIIFIIDMPPISCNIAQNQMDCLCCNAAKMTYNPLGGKL